MANTLRDEYGEASRGLAEFRAALGRLHAAGLPGVPPVLGELLGALDKAAAAMEAQVPAALTRLDQEVEAIERMNAENAARFEEVKAQFAEPPPEAEPPTAPGLPEGHGQTLREELLDRFAEPVKAVPPPVATEGDVHELASGDWHTQDSRSQAAPVPPRPQPPPKPPPKKTAGDDVGDMTSRDWR